MYDKQLIREKITTDFIINLMEELGSDYRSSSTGIRFKTICHGGNHYNLAWYEDTKMFHCYSECNESFDVFSLVMKVKGFRFPEALSFLASKLGIEEGCCDPFGGLETIVPKKVPISIESYQTEPQPYHESELELALLDELAHEPFQGWIDEGISADIQNKFEISQYKLKHWIIIPVKDINGHLIGVRRRALGWPNPITGEIIPPKNKYMPLNLNGVDYSFSSGQTLYGIYQNKENIIAAKKCVVFEGEKSVMKANTMYPTFPGVATFGHNLTKSQIKMMWELGVEEIIIAYDYDATGKEESEFNKLKKSVEDFSKISCTYLFEGYEKYLKAHDAPVDEGKAIFSQLVKLRK